MTAIPDVSTLVLVTRNRLIKAGMPAHTIPDETIEYWVKLGYSPERIVREIWQIKSVHVYEAS